METLNGSVSQGTINAYSNPLYLGYNLSSNGQWMDGEISNVRITKGQALYTSSFTVTTSPLTTTSQGATASNVKLLCCNSSSPTGNTVAPHSISYDGDPTASSVTVNGFSTGAIDFDGTDDFIYTSHSNDYDFDSDDFTIEAWIYPTNATQTDPSMITLWNFPDGRRSWAIFGNTGGSPATYNGSVRGAVSPDGQFATRTEISGTLTLNSWNHVAFTRSGNTLNFFINGTSQGTASYTGTVYSNTQDGVLIGAMGDSTDDRNNFVGKVSNVRVVRGQALYTSNFTSPTSALTTTSQSATASNVKLLCCQSSSSIIEADVSPSSIFNEGTVADTDNPF